MRSFHPHALLFVVVLVSSAVHAAEGSRELIERGRYLAIAADCTACHTALQDGAPFAGGYAIASPLGPIVATNITPSREHGIGAYSEAQFAQALRRGIRADGAHLYPAMPYTAYAKLSDADIHALFVYFREGVAPIERPTPATSLPFPFNLRFSMLVWNALFLDKDGFTLNATKTPAWNRGAYLAEALEHCSACHTPRGFLMQESGSQRFAGAPLGEWYAPNISSDPVSGIGTWSVDEIATYLGTGRVEGKAQAAGGMAEAVTHSLSRLSQADLTALATYIKDLPAIANGAAARTSDTWGASTDVEPLVRGNIAQKPDGAVLFSGLCASCHTNTGAGSSDQVYPSLFHNSTVGAERPDNLIAVVLHGVDRKTPGQHTFMPGFDTGSFVEALTDAEVAAVTTYVRTTFGRGLPAIDEKMVAVARRGGPASPLLAFVRVGMVAGGVLALILCGGLLRKLLGPRPARRTI